MLGTLHTKVALWICLKDLLVSLAALTDSFVAKSADSFLKASHITQAQHAHQVIFIKLSILQKEAFKDANTNAKENSFQFWKVFLKLEVFVLIFLH